MFCLVKKFGMAINNVQKKIGLVVTVKWDFSCGFYFHIFCIKDKFANITNMQN